MHSRRSEIIGLAVCFLIPLAWLLWESRTAVSGETTITPAFVAASLPIATAESVASISAASPAATVTAEPSPLPTSTPSPSATATTTLTPSAMPTPTDTATATATTALPTETLVPIDRTCPEPRPPRPDYNHYYLPADPWPTPNPTLMLPHFWLSPPLSGDEPLNINQEYPYGYDGSGRYLLHNGMDMSDRLGTPLLAIADGTVVVAQGDQAELYGWRCDWYGHLVVIQLDELWQGQPIYILYGHVLNITVEVGQRVRQGEQVAEIGVGGAAVVPHLHLEVRVGLNTFNRTRNPLLWLEPETERGVIVGRLIDPYGRPWQGVSLNLLGSGENPIVARTWSYLDDSLQTVNPDEGWAENFVFGNVRPGRYEVYTRLQGVEYRASVEVMAGEISAVEVVTEPLKTPTPAPPVTDTPGADALEPVVGETPEGI